MEMRDTVELPLARYRFTYRLNDPCRLPEYAGSLLRGQFGAVLRRIACMTRAPSCEGCTLRTTCPYPAVFEAPAPAQHDFQKFSAIPNPYVIEPPPAGTRRIDPGETLQFTMVLFGHALDHLSLISFAIQKVIEGGLGKERARGTLESIEVQNPGDETFEPIWLPGDAAIARHEPRFTLNLQTETPAPQRLELVLHTPLRLQHQGQPLHPDALSPRKLMADLLRRITLLAEFHADRPRLVENAPQLVAHADTLAHHHNLRWHDWTRYSSRQQREMKLGGAIGAWTWEGDLAPLLPWLHLGQWLHVGKNATLGLGRYRLHGITPST